MSTKQKKTITKAKVIDLDALLKTPPIRISKNNVEITDNIEILNQDFVNFYVLSDLKYANFAYCPNFILNPDELFEKLSASNWEQGSVYLYGKEMEEPRQSYMFAKDTNKPYEYSGRIVKTHPFPDYLDVVRLRLNYILNIDYDTCLMNYYKDGTSKIGMHSDKETSLVPNASIASITLGTPRHFDLHMKPLTVQGPYKPNHGQTTLEKYRIDLQHGSLLVMGKNSQHNYLHGVPAQKTVKTPRINLTFRVTK